MAPPAFVNRKDELELLESRFESDSAELLVVYGRRRLGKSALVREAIRDHESAVYWQATEETPDAQLANFVDAASETYPMVDDIQRDWEALLRALGREDAIVVLDEFPYLVESDDSLPSKIQRVWDTQLEETGISLVLVGSSISIMEEKVLSGGSPLYGRRTGAIDLPPLDLTDARQFSPENDPDSVIRTWGVFGGTPYYLQALTPDASLAENIQSHVLSEHGVLHNEPEFLLRTEFGIREPQTYYTAMSSSSTPPSPMRTSLLPSTRRTSRTPSKCTSTTSWPIPRSSTTPQAGNQRSTSRRASNKSANPTGTPPSQRMSRYHRSVRSSR